MKLNSSGFGLSRHYPVGSHPTAFADGFTTAMETPGHLCGVSHDDNSYHHRELLNGREWRLNLQP
jgi:hypothetical protein